MTPSQPRQANWKLSRVPSWSERLSLGAQWKILAGWFFKKNLPWVPYLDQTMSHGAGEARRLNNCCKIWRSVCFGLSRCIWTPPHYETNSLSASHLPASCCANTVRHYLKKVPSKKLIFRRKFAEYLGITTGLATRWPSPPYWICSTEILFQNFQISHNVLLNFANFWGGPISKSMQITKNRIETIRSQCANSRNLLKPFLRSRREKNLYGHCAMNNAQRILSEGSTLLRGCWFWSKKLRFPKKFLENFSCGGEGKVCSRHQNVKSH